MKPTILLRSATMITTVLGPVGQVRVAAQATARVSGTAHARADQKPDPVIVDPVIVDPVIVDPVIVDRTRRGQEHAASVAALGPVEVVDSVVAVEVADSAEDSVVVEGSAAEAVAARVAAAHAAAEALSRREGRDFLRQRDPGPVCRATLP